jgi:hypothetical protein
VGSLPNGFEQFKSYALSMDDLNNFVSAPFDTPYARP